jgi:DNA-directed RNA polymerase sigma subunit (sigma70/sigma32)
MDMDKEIKKHEKLLTSIANDYKTSGVPKEQLILAAQKGLVSAIELSKENSKWSFAKHGSWHIRQTVLKFIADSGKNEVGGNK